MKRYHLVRSILGGSDVYDESGNKVGYSLPSILGDGEDFYDMDGNPVGQSYDSILGEEDFSGPDAFGYMDDEIMMGHNAWLHGDPFKKSDSDFLKMDERNDHDIDFEDSDGLDW